MARTTGPRRPLNQFDFFNDFGSAFAFNRLDFSFGNFDVFHLDFIDGNLNARNRAAAGKFSFGNLLAVHAELLKFRCCFVNRVCKLERQELTASGNISAALHRYILHCTVIN